MLIATLIPAGRPPRRRSLRRTGRRSTLSALPAVPGSRVPARLAAAGAVAALAVAGCGAGSSSHTASGSASRTATNAAASVANTSAAAAGRGGFTAQPFASGVTILHSTPGGKLPVNQPDDLARLGDHIFVAFQNGVGPQGEPTSSGNQGAGNRNSTIVDFASSGSPVAQWDVAGHVDGLTADPSTGRLIVTANEDAKPHLFVIDPSRPEPAEYHVPTLPHHGGLDAISFYHGTMLVSASAPGTSGKAAPQASYPAVYAVRLTASTHTAAVHGVFSDEATTARANPGGGRALRLALTDPDSNTVVPAYAKRFAGMFELTSQADKEQIYMAGPGAGHLSTLKLSQSVDDSAWTSGPSGTLYVTDNGADLIYKITGPFTPGAEIVSVTPCDAGNAPSACPAPGFPSGYLGEADPATGTVTKASLGGAPIQPKGLLFVP